MLLCMTVVRPLIQGRGRHPVTALVPGPRECERFRYGRLPGWRQVTQIKETVIRRMTRLAAAHGAVNLAQGFTDEAPIYDMVWSAVAALLGGTEEGARRVESLTVREILHATRIADADSLDRPVKELFEQMSGSRDELNQYSFPFGLPELRHAIADYTQTCYGYRPDPEEEITVVLGASEGMAAAFRSLLGPGDGVVVMQPYHELYPSQAAIFGLVPRFVTLREDRRAGTWRLDRDELRAALSDPSVKAVVREHAPEPDRQGAGRGRNWDSSRNSAEHTTGSRSPTRSTSTSRSTATATGAWRAAKGWRSVRWW